MKLQNLDKVSPDEPVSAVPVGDYLVVITDAEEKVSKAGRDMIEVQLEITAGTYKGRGLRDWIVYTEAAEWKVRQVLDAVQIPIPEGEFELNAASLIGRRAAVAVVHNVYENKVYAKVDKWTAIELDDDVPPANETDVPF